VKRLKGEDTKISDGIALAKQHLGQIFVWALITATVGMIIRSLQERAGWIGRILFGFLGVAWNVITFFVTPVLLYEDLGAVDAIKRSASLFKQRWGEQLVGNATIGIAIVIVAIPVMVVGAGLFAVSPIVGGIFLTVAIGLLIAIGAALSGVFNAALGEGDSSCVHADRSNSISIAATRRRISRLYGGSGTDVAMIRRGGQQRRGAWSLTQSMPSIEHRVTPTESRRRRSLTPLGQRRGDSSSQRASSDRRPRRRPIGGMAHRAPAATRHR